MIIERVSEMRIVVNTDIGGGASDGHSQAGGGGVIVKWGFVVVDIGMTLTPMVVAVMKGSGKWWP